MKLKVNAFIFLVATCLMLALSSCTTPSTIVAVIVDSRRAPVNKPNIIVSASYGPGNMTKTTAVTRDDGTTTLRFTNVTYPVMVTANDGGSNKYSTVVVNNSETSRSGVTIVQNPKPGMDAAAPVTTPVTTSPAR